MEIKKSLKATRYILELVCFIVALPFTGTYLYRRNYRICQRFYFDMCSHHIFRIVYAFCFAGGIAAINSLYCYVMHDYTASSMTLAVSLLLLSDRVSHPLLQAVRRRHQLLYALMIISLAALFTPHMLPFAASLYLLIVAAVFYPSRRAVRNFQTYSGIQFYRKYPALLLDVYYY